MKTLQTRENLLEIIPKNLKIAELGVFKGDFSKLIKSICNPLELYLVDIFQGSIGSGDKDGNNFEFINLDKSFKELTNYFYQDNSVKIIKSYSDIFLNNLEDDFLDMVYIDADHSYEAVKKDLNLSFDKVKTGGIIMGHDYSLSIFPDLVRCVDEFCISKDLTLSYITEDNCPSYLIYKK